MPTRYIAFLADEDHQLHMVREDAEASLCGLPRAAMSSAGTLDDTTICRTCIDWTRRRWTTTLPAIKTGD
jgi:hypothetical protein